MKRSIQFLLCVIAVVCFGGGGIFAPTATYSQGIATGSLSGTVVDQSGGAVPDADVTAKNNATNQEFVGKTSGLGYVELRSLPPGSYKVTITAKNFRTLVVGIVEVVVAQNTELGGLKLEVGSVGETVQVEGAAPLIEANTSQVTTSFSSQETADLPLNGGFDALALFIPGVADTGSNSFSNSNGASFSSNGLRGRSNNFQIDGQSNNDNSVAGPSIFLGNQDVLDEVSVITNNFSVEYGRASGSVVNYVTKSGTNNFHGTGFEYFTGSHWDSHDNLETASDTIPRYVENRFGGTIGGPIKRNKAWFFFSPYFDRIREAGSPQSSGTALTPTPNGLSQLQAAFPGNLAVAALTAVGPYSIALGNPHPIGTPTILTVSDGVTAAPIEFAAIQRNPPGLFNDREFTGRVDVQISGKDRVGARYVFQQNIATGLVANVVTPARFAAGDWVDIPARDQQIALDWTHTFSGQFVNQLRYSFSRAGFGFEGGPFPHCTQANINDCPTNISLPTSLVSFGIQNNLPQGRIINNTQVQDNASLIRGHHTFKFGGEFYKQRSPNVFLPNTNGTYTFSGSNAAPAGSPKGTPGSCATAFPLLTSTSSAPCGFSRFLADSLQSGQLSLTDGTPKFNFKEYDIAAYFGDDWRVKDNLTINLGLRWEFSSQAINLLHELTIANQASSNPFWDPSLPSSVTTLPKIPDHYKYFGPNIGFAYNPHFFGMKGDKTVIRGGFRITYDPAYYNMFLNVATSAPVVNAGTITTATCTAPCLPTSGFLGSDVRAAHLTDIPRGVNPGVRNYTQVAPNFHEPYTQNWSLGVQEQITSKIVFETRYVGNREVGNFQTVNANPALAGLIANGFSSFIPAGVTPCATPGTPGFASERANCDFTNIRNRENTAFSSYNGLQTELRFRDFHGLSGGMSYTFSKTLDNASEIFSTFSGGTTVAGAQNPFDITRGEKALSGLDFPHTASLYFVYDLPFFKSQRGFLGHILGGYQASGTWRFSVGQLWTPTELAGFSSSCQTSFDNSFFSGASACRPFAGNTHAPVDSVGACTDPTLPDCGLVDYYTIGLTDSLGNPIPPTPTTASKVRWIYNDDNSAPFFHTPYGNVSRNPGDRGDNVNTVNFDLAKSIKFTERLSLRIEAQAYNLFNHRFLGVPDPFIDDLNQANGGTFANNFSNPSGGDYTNVTSAGLGRRRLILGARFIF
jgi:hypothetical protein